MPAVYAIRHPQTTWNVAERYQGRLEAPLSEEGERQATLILHSFERHSLDAVYSSPLGRAIGLAERLAHATGAELRVDDRLSEISMGPWEGLMRTEIAERYPDLYREWYAAPERVQFPDGESVGRVQTRALSCAMEIFECFPEGQVALVTHSVVVQSLAASALGLDLRYIHRISVTNGSTTTFCGREAPGMLLSLNDLSSLYRTPVGGARALRCPDWRVRRMTA
jgi:broad specificity phosphatase PhoE